MKRLSVGDAIAVAVLLFFILAWLAGWSFMLWWYEEDGGDLEHIGSLKAAALLGLAAFPCLWASGLVKSIVIGKWSER